MGFGAAISSGFGKYATFRGRASRSEFWWWMLFAWLLGMGAGVVDAVIETKTGSGVGIIGGLLGLALFLPGLAVSIRRLHDTDRTGWWYLIAFTIIGLVVLLVWFCTRGTEGSNAYGADPLDGPYGSGVLPSGVGVPGSFRQFDGTRRVP